MTVFKFTEKSPDIYSLAEFVNMTTSGQFIDYDGFGYFAIELHNGTFVVSDVKVYPSAFMSMLVVELPTWATHIKWYNR